MGDTVNSPERQTDEALRKVLISWGLEQLYEVLLGKRNYRFSLSKMQRNKFHSHSIDYGIKLDYFEYVNLDDLKIIIEQNKHLLGPMLKFRAKLTEYKCSTVLY